MVKISSGRNVIHSIRTDVEALVKAADLHVKHSRFGLAFKTNYVN